MICARDEDRKKNSLDTKILNLKNGSLENVSFFLNRSYLS